MNVKFYPVHACRIFGKVRIIVFFMFLPLLVSSDQFGSKFSNEKTLGCYTQTPFKKISGAHSEYLCIIYCKQYDVCRAAEFRLLTSECSLYNSSELVPQVGPDTCQIYHKTPIHGQWSAWQTGTCSLTCGGGTRTNTRVCNNPAPRDWGNPCVGGLTMNDACNTQPCAIHGQWSAWQTWGCSATCSGGTKMRSRSCTNPAPQYGGNNCVGSATENQVTSCNTQSCPEVNVLNKPTKSDSVNGAFNALPSRMVDGNPSNNFDDGTCMYMYTNYNNGQERWFLLDLGTSYTITNVKILRRNPLGEEQVYSDRFSKLSVAVTNDNTVWTTYNFAAFQLCHYMATNPNPITLSLIDFYCAVPRSGRYLTIHKAPSNIDYYDLIDYCEIRVFVL